jgi:hypothetical protein
VTPDDVVDFHGVDVINNAARVATTKHRRTPVWFVRQIPVPIETCSLPALTHVLPPISTCGLPIYVARVPAAPFTRSYPRHFTFYVADPISSIASRPHCKHLPEMIPGVGAGLVIPDLWQQEAVRALQQGKDVVVQAPTGSGKTYIFELLYPNLKTQAVFTVPTRALANDKLSEWRARGWDVGISTGDVALNLDAKVVVATLETQRGRFLRGEGPGLLVMDEFQMLGDPMRGVHYELAVALAPKATQLLFLSGSVANPRDVVAWLQRIGRDAVLIEHKTRPVPLEETDLGNLPDSQFVQSRSPSRTGGSFWPRMIGRAMRAELAPVLVFAPRRAAAEQIAQAIASALPVREPLRLTPAQKATAGKSLTKLLRNRVAYHHSGLSYAARAGVVESLAKAGQLNVVVATMGLAAGINFSMRSVIVTDRRYFAGNFERQVEADELLQMFGRAGRRGLDEVGHALYTNDLPRLSDTKARQLRRATQVDWPSLISGLAVAVALEDETYPIDELVFDLANIRAGPRFAGEDAALGGRLGILCQRVYRRADYPGYLSMGVPVQYGAGASEVVRALVADPRSKHKLTNELLRHGDIERALVEWRSILRHIVLAPAFPLSRWGELKAAAEELVDKTASPTSAVDLATLARL